MHETKVFLAADAKVHAPAASMAAVISAYTAGADGAVLTVQQTKDLRLVCCGDSDLSASTQQSGKIRDFDFAVIKRLNSGARFTDAKGNHLQYTSQFLSLEAMLRALPADLECVVAVPAGVEVGSRASLLELTARIVAAERPSAVMLLAFASDVGVVRGFSNVLNLAVEKAVLDGANDLPQKHRIDAVAAPVSAFFENDKPTAFAETVSALHAAGKLARGALLVTDGGILTTEVLDAARATPSVWALTTTSMPAIAFAARCGNVMVDDTFIGTTPDLEVWSFGYARVGNACHVQQQDGVHIVISPYSAPVQTDPADDLERRLRRLESEVALALRQTTTYTGGGVGHVQGVEGPFAVEADVTSARATQATMCELAITNINPGRHLPSYNPDGTLRFPRDDHEKHAFFDPHGAPPFVGSEHDEDDGFRINSHFGSEYADNNYGSDVGDGTLLEVTLRLERRGPYVATYFRPRAGTDLLDWVCSGGVRNDSLNPRVFVRCAGKRWQKADPSHAGSTLPVVDNHFTVSRITIVRFDA